MHQLKKEIVVDQFYDKRGNIVGVAVKRLNVSQSDNFNFAIKGTTVKKQFLDANGVITSLANRKSQMSSTDTKFTK